MLSKKQEVRKYDLSSMRWLYVGAAPTGSETVEGIMKMFPHLHLAQGYGMTETSPVSISTGENDILHGSSGSLLPGIRAKLVDYKGNEVTEYETRGELHIQSPSVTLGYLNNEKATAETFVWDQDGRWCRTGDEVIVRKSPSGSEHIFIVDRIKELIKVKVRIAPIIQDTCLRIRPNTNIFFSGPPGRPGRA
jgi:long-subunit acyl-CoA synthetase (AMP-forming)